MRRLPRSVRIIGHRVGVFKHKDLKYTANGHQHEAYGLYEPGDLRIFIDPTYSEERQKTTLLHETLHASLNVACIDNVENEEDLVTRLAPILLDVIRNNRGLIAYLQEVPRA